jgi:hypothetical protein
MDTPTKPTGRVTPWNMGQLLGQKPPLKLKEIWAIRMAGLQLPLCLLRVDSGRRQDPACSVEKLL